MTDADSVRSLDQVTAEWLTGRMRAAGHTDAEVIGFRHQPVGTGQMGNSVRFTLEYSRTGPDLPSTIVGKFPSEDPLSRMTSNHKQLRPGGRLLPPPAAEADNPDP